IITRRSYVWYDRIAEGGAPMKAGLTYCAEVARQWIATHPDSFPPVVVNVTDGEPTHGDPEPAAAALRGLATSDGNVLLVNCRLSERADPPVLFPDSEDQLSDAHGRMLFRMSSPLPERLVQMATSKGFELGPSGRCMIVNADATVMVQLIPT